MKALKIAGKVLLWTLVGLVAIVLIAFGLLQTEVGRGWVKDIVLGVLNDTFKGSIEVERIGGFLPFDATLEGVVIKDPEGNVTVSVASVAADFEPLALLDSKIHLSNIRVVDPVVSIFDEKGRLMIGRAFEPRNPGPPSPEPSPWTIELEGIDLTRGRVTHVIPGDDLALEQVTLDLAFGLSPKGPLWREVSLHAIPVGTSELARALKGGPIVLASEGELGGDTLRIDKLDVNAGPHAVSATAKLDLKTMDGEVHLVGLHADLDALPPAVRGALMGLEGIIDGSGQVTLTKGEAVGRLALQTPLGWLSVQGGAVVMPALGDFAGNVWVFDTVLPRGLQDRIPREVRAMRVDTSVAFHGRGDPTGPEGDIDVDLEIWQRSKDDLGHLAVTFARDHSEPGVEHRPIFNFDVQGESLRVQPWLGLLGQRDLAGELFGIWAEGTVGIPTDDEPLSIGGMYAVDGTVSGVIMPSATLLSVPLFSTLGSISWDGVTEPAGHAELAASDVVAENANVGIVAASVDVLGDGKGHVRLDGIVRAANATRFDVHADSIEVPFDIVIVDPLPVGDIGLVLVEAKNMDHAADRVEADLHLVREGEGLRLHGDVKLGGASVMHGAHRVGSGQLHVDYHLTALDPLDPMVVPSRGTVQGSFANVASGGRSIGVLKVDLRAAASNGFDGPIVVSGKTTVEGVKSPEADVESGLVWVDVVVNGTSITGQADIDAVGALVKLMPPTGGRRFDAVHFDVRALGGNRLALDGRLEEKRQLTTFVKATVGLPINGRKVTAEIDEVRAQKAAAGGGRFAPQDLVTIKGARYDASGKIELGTITLGTGGAAKGLTFTGVIDPARGTLAVKGQARDMRLDDWVKNFYLLTRLDIGEKPDADGVLSFSLDASGTLAEPRLQMQLQLREARLQKQDHGALDLDVVLEAKRFRGTYGVQWSKDGRLDGTLDLPVDISFQPMRVALDRHAPLTISMKAKVPNVREALDWATAATGSPVLTDVSGQTDMSLDVTGTVVVPQVTFRATPLELGKWRGAIRLDAGPAAMEPGRWHASTIVEEQQAKASKKPEQDEIGQLMRFDVDLPSAIFEALWHGHPDEIQRVLRTEPIGLVAKLPEHALGSLPGVDLIKDFAFADVRVKLDLRIEGKYPDFEIGENSLVRATELQSIGFAGGVEARLTSVGDKLVVLVMASGLKEGLVNGQIAIPRFGTLLGNPGAITSLVNDEDFKVDLHTASLPTDRLIDLDPDLGQTIEMLFPYSTAAVHVLAKGSAEGPEATVMLTVVENSAVLPEKASTPTESDTSMSGATTLAEQTYVVAQVRPTFTEVRATLIPDTKIGAGLSLLARADVGTNQLLAGEMPVIESIPIKGALHAEQFRLDGLMSALQETLGGTRGYFAGDLEISGTIGAPVFSGVPELHLAPLAVPMIGFDQPLDIYLTFDGNRIALQDPIVFESKGKETEKMELNFAADLKSLKPEDIKLDGSLVLERYEALSTADMKARASGKVTIAGTAAKPVIRGNIDVIDGVIAPNIAQREVRAMGLPADVHLVRGDPKVPTGTTKRVTSKKTALDIDVQVSVPANKVRVEPHIVQPFGEVRALLWPYGKLDIRTVQREIGIFGTVYVPKENIYLYGKKFTVDNDSRIVFTGDMQTDPQIFFTARYNIEHIDLTPIGLQTGNDSEVVVRVTGSPTTRLRIDFGSNPPMDEANILSVIALDQPVGGGEGLGDAVTTQIAGAVLGMATLEITRDLVDKLPIDVLRIEGSSSNLDQARLTLGKRFTKDVFFYTYVNVNADEDESVYELSAEYKVSRIFSALVRWGEIGELSLEGSLRFQP